MRFIIEEKLANAILNYLANKPYIEVAGLMHGMNSLQPFPEKPLPCEETGQGCPGTENQSS
jgi:hypothetical protein